ncbi:MAG: LCP family protein [Candidatus Eremiobacteraeota bacterium]|nr:LCP family protein [Candidatus Eremiobacteraeota bacterium]
MSKSVVITPPVPRRTTAVQTLLYVVGTLLVLIGIGFGVVAYRMVVNHTGIAQATMSLLDPFIPTPSSVFGKERIYVLVLGIDFNYDDKDMPYSKGARSDTIMVAGLDFPTRSLRLISILRDTEAMVNGRDVKINEAYSQGGIKLADRVIGSFLGMPQKPTGEYFDRYMVVNSFGVKDFVNAIGGIDVPVTEQMDYDDRWGHLSIHFKPGMHHMSGDQAVGYTRFRHDACSDLCRTQRQQQVIHITMAKLKAQRFNDLLHIVPLINAVNKNVMTNLTLDEEKSLAWSFKDANLPDLNKAETLRYVDTKETPYGGEVVIPDARQKAQLVAQLLGPYGHAKSVGPAALAAVKPSTVHLVLENGSGVAGLAGTAAEQLRKDGYVIDEIANADAFTYDQSQILPASRTPFVGERIRQDLGVDGAQVAPATDATPGPVSVVTVILGKDYAASRLAAPPTASAVPRR